MLTRRHIRIKVMQAIYALSLSPQSNIKEQEKFLNSSIEDMYNLYLLLLNLLIEIQKTAEKQLALSQKKYLATKEEKNPNKKFVANKILTILRNNSSLNNEIKKRKLTQWETDDKYVRMIYQDIFESEVYRAYMTTIDDSFHEDKKFLIAIFKEYIAQNTKLYTYIEDYKLTWIDDFPLINTLILKVLRKTKSTENHHFLMDLYKNDEDKSFPKELFRKTVLNNKEIQEQLEGKTPNWDMERIADVDAILLKMAICEFLKFPTIPVKVTMNEYLEIAKEYSTPKSSLFINGILDKLIKEYYETNKLNKTGRGLM